MKLLAGAADTNKVEIVKQAVAQRDKIEKVL